MKLKNNSIGPKVIHYISTHGGRRAVTIESNGIVEINDCVKVLNEIEIEHKWVSVVEEDSTIEKSFPAEENSPVEKMKKASEDVESYISEPEEKIYKIFEEEDSEEYSSKK